jgi:hypothetical protein
MPLLFHPAEVAAEAIFGIAGLGFLRQLRTGDSMYFHEKAAITNVAAKAAAGRSQYDCK